MALSTIDSPEGQGMSSRQVLEEMYELVCRALPQIPLDDGGRASLAALAPHMGALLGRPPARVLTREGER